jgi:sulfate adenylyltransferase subunit 2
MNHLDKIESKSIYIMREAYAQFKNVALLWSIGKDSSCLLHLARKAFYGKLPFPVVHIDTSYKFPEMIQWRNDYAKKWGLDLVVGQNKKALDEGMNHRVGKLDCCNALKTQALKDVIAEKKYRAIMLGIRRDEHGIRAKERVFSPRNSDFVWDYKNQPPELWNQFKAKAEEQEHIRVHPLLHWTEIDIWRYIERENIPIIDLYFAKQRTAGESTRFRSIGCQTCCGPVFSEASNIPEILDELETTNSGEREGRAQDKEEVNAMQKLRSLGYM